MEYRAHSPKPIHKRITQRVNGVTNTRSSNNQIVLLTQAEIGTSSLEVGPVSLLVHQQGGVTTIIKGPIR